MTIRSNRCVIGLGAALGALVLVAACGSSGGNEAAPQLANPDASALSHAGHTGNYSPPPAAPLRSGERFVNLTMAQPYTPVAPNGGTDEYRCFLVDPHLTSMAYLTGDQFLPQNTAIVHHSILFRIAPDQVASAKQVDAQSPGEGWTCFGDAGVSGDSAWVGTWAPGVSESLLAPTVGYPMPAGSQLVMQVHYNLLASGGKAAGSDQSGLRLRLTDGKTALKPLQTETLPAPIELPCTASESGPLCDRSAAIADVTKRFGEEVGSSESDLVNLCDGGKAPVPGNTQHCDHQITQAGTIYAVAGHMHLLGKAITIELNPGKPDARTLLSVPNYNFDNQAIQPLATPVSVKPGDTYRVTCTHDAGLRKLLPQLSNTPPRYVVWGDGTSDEMCLGLVIFSPADGS